VKCYFLKGSNFDSILKRAKSQQEEIEEEEEEEDEVATTDAWRVALRKSEEAEK